MSRIDGVNRVVLLLLGMILVGAGAYGLSRGWGVFGDAQAQDPLLGETLVGFVRRNAEWFWPAAALVALVAAYGCYRWLRAQIPLPQRAGSIDLSTERSRGFTRVRAGGAANGLAADIERHPGVSSAKARIVSDEPVPEVEMRVDLFERADLIAVRDHVEQTALPRFRKSLGSQELSARTLFRAAQSAGRVLE